jgi:hypothetical protein
MISIKQGEGFKDESIGKFEIMKDFFQPEQNYKSKPVIFHKYNDLYRQGEELTAGRFYHSNGGYGIFYDYRFNIASGNSLLPFSLLHHTGIRLGLNNC